MGKNPNRYPIYIPSKGRSEFMITSRHLTALGLHHYIVVEPQEVLKYNEAVSRYQLSTTVLQLDMRYKERYELLDNIGLVKSTGSGPARNFAWDHAKQNGDARHWIMDDNIRGFSRLNGTMKIKVSTPSIICAMEDFVDRYVNVAMAGPDYAMFAYAANPSKVRPFITNTRIYSCNLIRTDLSFRWRGRYNEDTILSLDMLKAGWCTILFKAFLQNKMATQVLPGGNTTELYRADTRQHGERYAKYGTIEKSQMLANAHPDVAKVVKRFGRIHHIVNYGAFNGNKLIRRAGVELKPGVDNYGMELRQKPGEASD